MKDQKKIQDIKLFCEERLSPISSELDIENKFPRELLGEMATLGMFKLSVPEIEGGLGLSHQTAFDTIAEISKYSAGVGLTLHVHWMAIGILLKFGSDAQKKKYLPAMLSGDKIGAFCVSEMQAGSDAASIQAKAIKTEDGYMLSGPKWFCTNGGIADIYFVGFKTDENAGAKGISMFIIEKATEGFEITEKQEKLGCRSSETTGLIFKNCHVPVESLIGVENKGFKIAMSALTDGRLGMAAMGIGISEGCFNLAKEYANERIAFGKPLSAQYAIQSMMADIYIKLQGTKALLHEITNKLDNSKDVSLESSAVKLLAADVCNTACHNCLQVFGGHGYMKYKAIERYARDGRLLDIGVGASEVLKMVVGSTVLR